MRFILFLAFVVSQVLAICPLPEEVPPSEYPPGWVRSGDVIEWNDGTNYRFQCRNIDSRVYYIMQLEAGAKSYTTGLSFKCNAASGKWFHDDGYEAPARLNCGMAVSRITYCGAYHTYPNGAVGGSALYTAGEVVGYADGRGIRSISCKGTILTIEQDDGTITKHTLATYPTLKCVPGTCKQVCSGPTTTTTTTTVAPTTTIPATCPVGGVWSEWTVTGQCATTCGSCNTAARKRTCTTDCGNCPCIGESEDVGPCGITTCPFVDSSSFTCCLPFVKTVNYLTGKHFCGNGTSVQIPKCKIL